MRRPIVGHPHVNPVRGARVPGLVAERSAAVATDDFARHASAERSAALRIDASGEPRQLPLGDLEDAGCVAVGVECVHPLDGVLNGEVFEEEAGQAVGQADVPI